MQSSSLRKLLAISAGFLAALTLYLLVSGQVWLAPGEVLRELFAGPGQGGIIWTLRIPRALAAILIGGTLGVSGLLFQALFRNPLAEPYVVGVSSGAAAGGALMLILAGSGVAVVLGALFGGWVALALVLAIGAKASGSRLGPVTVLLAGVIVGAMLSGMTSALLVLSGQDSSRILAWMLGSLSSVQLVSNGWIAVGLLLVAGWAWLHAPDLNAMAMGPEAAQQVGVDVHRLTQGTLFLAGGLVSVTVGFAGIIGFVGLLAPHLARRLAGPDLRRAWWVAGILGAVLLLTADAVASRVIRSAELPVSAVTAVLGAPALLVLFRRAT